MHNELRNADGSFIYVPVKYLLYIFFHSSFYFFFWYNSTWNSINIFSSASLKISQHANYNVQSIWNPSESCFVVCSRVTNEAKPSEIFGVIMCFCRNKQITTVTDDANRLIHVPFIFINGRRLKQSENSAKTFGLTKPLTGIYVCNSTENIKYCDLLYFNTGSSSTDCYMFWR